MWKLGGEYLPMVIGMAVFGASLEHILWACALFTCMRHA